MKNLTKLQLEWGRDFESTTTGPLFNIQNPSIKDLELFHLSNELANRFTISSQLKSIYLVDCFTKASFIAHLPDTIEDIMIRSCTLDNANIKLPRNTMFFKIMISDQKHVLPTITNCHELPNLLRVSIHYQLYQVHDDLEIVNNVQTFINKLPNSIVRLMLKWNIFRDDSEDSDSHLGELTFNNLNHLRELTVESKGMILPMLDFSHLPDSIENLCLQVDVWNCINELPSHLKFFEINLQHYQESVTHFWLTFLDHLPIKTFIVIAKLVKEIDFTNFEFDDLRLFSIKFLKNGSSEDENEIIRSNSSTFLLSNLSMTQAQPTRKLFKIKLPRLRKRLACFKIVDDTSIAFNHFVIRVPDLKKNEPKFLFHPVNKFELAERQIAQILP
ncbi:unnamed protein product [Ambrosiozyma monospora]|uniref:Unnamed protein product n=1 Tax=Ambrosiozyma monospora TaxID=43982 RepID=A0A9W6YWF2_AMBMO|nr:unnamed protein product [Ambrosiozyma monospora]